MHFLTCCQILFQHYHPPGLSFLVFHEWIFQALHYNAGGETEARGDTIQFDPSHCGRGMGAEPGRELPCALPDLALAVSAQMCIAASRCAGGEEGWAASLGRPWEEDGRGAPEQIHVLSS